MPSSSLSASSNDRLAMSLGTVGSLAGSLATGRLFQGEDGRVYSRRRRVEIVHFREGVRRCTTRDGESRNCDMAALHVRIPKPPCSHCGALPRMAASVPQK